MLGVAVARFIADFTGQDRIEAIHLVLTQLCRRVEPDRGLACELAWEIHTGAYWSQLKDAEGRPYESEEAYFREVLGVASWRTAYKRASRSAGCSAGSRHWSARSCAPRSPRSA